MEIDAASWTSKLGNASEGAEMSIRKPGLISRTAHNAVIHVTSAMQPAAIYISHMFLVPPRKPK